MKTKPGSVGMVGMPNVYPQVGYLPLTVRIRVHRGTSLTPMYPRIPLVLGFSRGVSCPARFFEGVSCRAG